MPKPIVTFDFDDTLCMEDGTPNFTMMSLVHKYAAEGFKCYIVTARNKAHESLKWINKNGGTRIRVKISSEIINCPSNNVTSQIIN